MGMSSLSAKVVILRLAVGSEVFEDFDGVLVLELAVLFRIGVLGGFGDPEAAAVVEVDVERLMDVRVGGDELGLEAGRQVEAAGLVGRRTRVGVGDVHLVGKGQSAKR